MPASSVKFRKRTFKDTLQEIKWAWQRLQKSITNSPFFREVAGRLAVLLHASVHLVCFVVVVVRISLDAQWWRDKALQESYAVCRSEDTNFDTMKLCDTFRSDLQQMLDAMAVAVAVLTFGLCTGLGSLACSQTLANSTRLDHENWFSKRDTRVKVGRFRNSGIARLSFSKACQWRITVLFVFVWSITLLTYTVAYAVITYYVLVFKESISEYSQELFPELQDEYSWGSVVLSVVSLAVVFLIDGVMLASAIYKLYVLHGIKDEWDSPEETDGLLHTTRPQVDAEETVVELKTKSS